jgi:hypothetical protein
MARIDQVDEWLGVERRRALPDALLVGALTVAAGVIGWLLPGWPSLIVAVVIGLGGVRLRVRTTIDRILNGKPRP